MHDIWRPVVWYIDSKELGEAVPLQPCRSNRAERSLRAQNLALKGGAAVVVVVEFLGTAGNRGRLNGVVFEDHDDRAVVSRFTCFVAFVWVWIVV